VDGRTLTNSKFARPPARAHCLPACLPPPLPPPPTHPPHTHPPPPLPGPHRAAVAEVGAQVGRTRLDRQEDAGGALHRPVDDPALGAREAAVGRGRGGHWRGSGTATAGVLWGGQWGGAVGEGAVQWGGGSSVRLTAGWPGWKNANATHPTLPARPAAARHRPPPLLPSRSCQAAPAKPLLRSRSCTQQPHPTIPTPRAPSPPSASSQQLTPAPAAPPPHPAQGFLAAELLAAGIPVTIVDPCFGITGGRVLSSVLSRVLSSVLSSALSRVLSSALSRALSSVRFTGWWWCVLRAFFVPEHHRQGQARGPPPPLTTHTLRR
jgi:hypothetical protein